MILALTSAFGYAKMNELGDDSAPGTITAHKGLLDESRLCLQYLGPYRQL